MSARQLAMLLIFGGIFAPVVAPAEAPAIAEQLADRMLGAIGGRSRWAKVTNTINDSRQNRLDEPTVVHAVIRMDFTRPRFRIDTTAPGLSLTRVIDGERNWRLTRDGRIEDVPEETVRADLQWYAGHVYRTLHRIAARDPALRLGMDDRGRLEVYEQASRIAWFALDARGEPYAFGAHDDDTGSITGPWNFIREGVGHPAWVARPDGSWRSQIRELAINAQLTDADFARPAGGDDVDRQRGASSAEKSGGPEAAAKYRKRVFPDRS